ncbi:Chromatin assembly factor 1 subunit B [Amphibalanus amphitrite]|uniref:Chromatin assembly factor 1 subunit B n=1 Tax=Amphibalanus amphitrite TaxID=1232801 RepID=A0A6A4WXS5_AMPAM|nr:Chromatin assembly factor 1 subunit B [Amphibalanus amphitrite]
MKCTVPQISWHNKDPVLSLDVHSVPITPEHYRIASGGNDSHVVMWEVTLTEGDSTVEVLADLTHHLKPVNVVRFAPIKDILLASADDDGHIILWRRQDHPNIMLEMDGADFREHYCIHKTLRGHLQDVYDLCWSADGAHLISGAVDNTAILWDVQKGVKMQILSCHESFVQGVAWDPLNKVVATLSCDRHCRIFNVQTGKCISKVQKLKMPHTKEDGTVEEKACRLFHDDTLQTFCRRLSFTPDGTLLLAPAGLLETGPGAKLENVVHVFSRHDFSRPVFCLPSTDKYTIAVRCCPTLYKLRMRHPPEPGKPLWEQTHTLLKLPYRMVMAVATRCSVLLYDTQQEAPFARISNIHFTRLTDLSWSRDGRLLMVSSTDGFCSVITFDDGELGEPYLPSDEQRGQGDCNGNTATDTAARESVPAAPARQQAETPAQAPVQPPAKSPVQPPAPAQQRPQEQKASAEPPPSSERPPPAAGDAPRTPSRRVPLVTLSSPRRPAARTPSSAAEPAAEEVAEQEPEPQEQEQEPMEAEDDGTQLVLHLEETTRELDEGPGSPAAVEPPPQPSPRTPRRVPLVTLSSPKRSPKPRTPAKTDG